MAPATGGAGRVVAPAVTVVPVVAVGKTGVAREMPLLEPAVSGAVVRVRTEARVTRAVPAGDTRVVAVVTVVERASVDAGVAAAAVELVAGNVTSTCAVEPALLPQPAAA